MIIIIMMIITWSGSCRRRKAPSLRSWPRLLSWRNLLRRSHLVDFDAFVWFWFWRLCLILILILMTLSDFDFDFDFDDFVWLSMRRVCSPETAAEVIVKFFSGQGTSEGRKYWNKALFLSFPYLDKNTCEDSVKSKNRLFFPIFLGGKSFIVNEQYQKAVFTI